MTRRETFSRNLRNLIELSGKPQRDIADAIGEKYTTLNMWATGNSLPRADKLQKLAEYFDVRIDELLNEAPPVRIKTDLEMTAAELEGLDSDQLAKVRDYIQFIKYEGSKR